MTEPVQPWGRSRRVDPKARRRATWRRTWFGLQTALGVARRGWFIPQRHAGRATPAGRRPPYAAVESLFTRRRPAFAARLEGLADWRDDLLAIGMTSGAGAPEARWTQDWFPRLDAAMAYDMVRRERPGRIVEVGSGHSTRFLLRALADSARVEGGDDEGGNDEGARGAGVTAIDPAPRATLERAGERLTLIRRSLQEVGLAPFEGLRAGDLLLIDSSHVLMPGSDVDLLFGHVLPALPAGVLLHIHDIFLPDDYPLAWAWRGYNEQLALPPLLLSGGWDTLFASHFVASRMPDAVADSVAGELPLSEGAFESSLWLRKTAPGPGPGPGA